MNTHPILPTLVSLSGELKVYAITYHTCFNSLYHIFTQFMNLNDLDHSFIIYNLSIIYYYWWISVYQNFMNVFRVCLYKITVISIMIKFMIMSSYWKGLEYIAKHDRFSLLSFRYREIRSMYTVCILSPIYSPTHPFTLICHLLISFSLFELSIL